MTEKQFGKNWTKGDTVKSLFLFLMHFVILVVITGLMLLGDKFNALGEYMRENGADYLYALFSVFLLVFIMYFYFLFEDKEMISNATNIALIFTILDLYVVVSLLIGQKIHIYARPVALVALLFFVLVGRRDAIFMTIVGALLMFVIDTFTGATALSAKVYYSSLLFSSADRRKPVLPSSESVSLSSCLSI